MNEWDRLHRMAEHYKAEYPSGTRIVRRAALQNGGQRSHCACHFRFRREKQRHFLEVIMPNHVTNIIEIKGDPNRLKSLFEAVKNDEHGLGSIDFNKLIPMPPELDIEEGSQTKRGLKAYKDFIEVYTFNGKKEDFDLLNIPEKSKQAFLRVRPDIDRAAWNLGRQAFQNEQKYGAAIRNMRRSSMRPEQRLRLTGLMAGIPTVRIIFRSTLSPMKMQKPTAPG